MVRFLLSFPPSFCLFVFLEYVDMEMDMEIDMEVEL